MTPKEKAESLVDKFMDYTEHRFNEHNNLSNVYTAKQCALIAVELKLEGDFSFTSIEYGEDSLEYWEEVKDEIEKL